MVIRLDTSLPRGRCNPEKTQFMLGRKEEDQMLTCKHKNKEVLLKRTNKFQMKLQDLNVTEN